MKTQDKQKKILTILKNFPTKKLNKITEDSFDFDKLTKKESFLFMECVWIDLGKEQATKKELSKGINHVYTLLILECLRRHNLVKINKEGFFDKTKIGNEVNKLLDKKKPAKVQKR